MKTLKKVIALVLCLVTVFSCFSMSVYAANYTSRYGNYNSPENSGDWAQYENKKVKRSSSTSVDEVRWMQAALNYCMDAEGLNKINGYDVSKLDVDGSFGPASKKVTEAFQKAAGLTVDGSFGPSTIKKMKSILNDKKINSLVPVTVVNRPTNTSTSTTTTTTSTNTTFKQQNILQVSASSSSNYISGDWYKLENGPKCTCTSCQKYTYEYGNHKYISGAGCGIVSLVSAVYNLGDTIDKDQIGTVVKEVFNWAYTNNYWTKSGASWSMFAASDEKFGDKYAFNVLETNEKYGCFGYKDSEKTDLSDLIKHLKENKGTAVVHVYGHYMVAVDYKVENGVEKIRIFDPAPGGGTNWNSSNRKTSNGTAITTADGNWFAIKDLQRDGGSKGKYKNSAGKWISYGYENIEIDGYWLVSKK